MRLRGFGVAMLSCFLLGRFSNADCECGFQMNDTQDYFTHIIYSNFSAFAPTKTLLTNPDFTRDWAVQKWGIPVLNWATPLPIDNSLENVYIQDGNLILRQQGYSKEAILLGKNVSVASIASQSGDIYHGSFRVELKMEGATGGSVAGFFWYHDDKNEIDIEILSKEFRPDSMLVHYTTHPSLDANGSLIENATEVVRLKGDDPASSFQQHRFDWTPDDLKFYQNSKLVHVNNYKVPDVAGSVMMNLWADGGIWSGTPSTTDVFLSIKSISIYHNTSLSDIGLDEKFNFRCEKAGGPSNWTICLDTEVESGQTHPAPNGSAPTFSHIWVLTMLCLVSSILVIVF